MGLKSRLNKIDAGMSRCNPRAMLLAPMGQVPSEADRCPRCGGSHVHYVEEIIVASRADAEMYLTRNGDPS